MPNIIDVNESNLSEYPQVICFINPKHEYYNLKIEWLKEQFDLGLKIKLYINPEDKKVAGYIEYIPGEYAFRGVDAKDYLFIHCIWMNPNKNKMRGFASELVKEVINEAKQGNKKGVAVITSDGAFMSKKELFIKNGLKVVDEANGFQLLTLEIDGAKPSAKFKYDLEKLKALKGWNIYYSKQCPWVARSIKEIEPIIKNHGIDIKINKFKSYKDAQDFGTIYSAFNLVVDGKLLADRYISSTRFQNIVNKEFKK